MVLLFMMGSLVGPIQVAFSVSSESTSLMFAAGRSLSLMTPLAIPALSSRLPRRQQPEYTLYPKAVIAHFTLAEQLLKEMHIVG